MARRAGLPWDAILGAEVSRAYKPQPEAYDATARFPGAAARTTCLMVRRPSSTDLAPPPPRGGSRTAYVHRPAGARARPRGDAAFGGHVRLPGRRLRRARGCARGLKPTLQCHPGAAQRTYPGSASPLALSRSRIAAAGASASGMTGEGRWCGRKSRSANADLNWTFSCCTAICGSHPRFADDIRRLGRVWSLFMGSLTWSPQISPWTPDHAGRFAAQTLTRRAQERGPAIGVIRMKVNPY